MSGRVNVRYCSASARLLYRYPLVRREPDSTLSFEPVSTGVVIGLQFDIFVRCSLSLEYMACDKNKPEEVLLVVTRENCVRDLGLSLPT